MIYIIEKIFQFDAEFVIFSSTLNPHFMLDHQKSILVQLSGNKELFRKEIVKSFKWLKSYEILQLHQWLKENYMETHGDIIKDIFQHIAA